MSLEEIFPKSKLKHIYLIMKRGHAFFIYSICLISTIVLILGVHTAFATDAHIDALIMKGQNFRQEGNLQDDLAAYQELLTWYHATENLQNEGETCVTLGSLSSALGQYEETIQYFTQAAAVFQQMQNRRDEAVALIYLAATHIIRSRYENALEVLRNALAIAAEIDDPAVKSASLKWMGDVYMKSGHFQEALDTYQRIVYPEEEYRNRVVLMASQASAYSASGRYREAIAMYGRAGEVLRSAAKNIDEAAQTELESGILLSTGITYLHLGEYEKALRILQDALRSFRQREDAPQKAAAFTAIGGIYEEREAYLKAVGMYKQAFEIQRSAQDSTGMAVTLNNIAKAWDRFCLKNGSPEHHEEALRKYEEALNIAHSTGAQMIEAKILNNIGELHMHLSEYHKKTRHIVQAFTALTQALTLQQAIQDQANKWITLGNIGRIYELQTHYEEALRYYQQSVELLEELTTYSRVEEFTISLRARAAGMYQRIVLLLLQMGREEEAFEFSERARARAFLDQLGNMRFHLLSDATTAGMDRVQTIRAELAELERELRQEYQKPKVSQQHERIRFLEEQRAKKRSEYENIRITIKANNPEYASMLSIEPLSLDNIQKLLYPETTLLSYFVTTESSAVFIITRNSFNTMQLPIGEKALKTAIHDLRQPAGINDPVPEALEFLHDKLIAPLKPHIETPLLGIIPYGVLHYLPFAALTDGKTFLGDEYALFFLPGAAALKFLTHARKSSDYSVLALASSRAQGLPELVFAAQEAQAIAAYYARYYKTRLLIQTPLPTETAFKTFANRFSILHLAAHAELNTKNPLFSRILLAPDGENDGALEVHEIYELNLAHTHLVVLSACDTKLGKLSQGDDIIGLNRAFLHAGTSSVLASLWKVDDLATRDFMIAFYLQLRFSTSMAHALQAAQRITRDKYPHPYYWAGFVLTGAPGENF